MLRFLHRAGFIAIFLAAAVSGRAQQLTPAPGRVATPKPDASATPRVIIGATPPKAEPAPSIPALPAEPVLAPVAEGRRLPNLNALIVDIIRDMPQGGGYATNAGSFAALRRGIRTDGQGHLTLDPAVAQPSFCSGATYFVLLSVIDDLLRNGHLRLPDEVLAALEVKSQPDGVGVWGRWNANGPGTARLFHELGMGRNFTDYAEAREGDFIKMFWNEHIGSLERGHSAVFLKASRDERGQETVTFWSSNVPGGYGMKTIPKSNIKRVLFSRLEHPARIADAGRLPAKDEYLASMLKRTSTPAEMMQMVGIGGRAANVGGAGEAPRARTGSVRLPDSVTSTGEPTSPGATTPAAGPKSRTPVTTPAAPKGPPAEKAAPGQTPAAAATPEPKKTFLQRLIGR